jgi:hypothetical protein
MQCNYFIWVVKTMKTLDSELTSMLNFAKFAKKEILERNIVYKNRIFLTLEKGRVRCSATNNSGPEGDEIWIERGQAPKEKSISLIHELLHDYHDWTGRDVRDCVVERQAQKIYRCWPKFSNSLSCYLPAELNSS